MEFKKTAPADRNHQGPGRNIGAPELGYHSSGCVPTEPDSVSPVAARFSQQQPPLDTGQRLPKSTGAARRILESDESTKQLFPLYSQGITSFVAYSELGMMGATP